MCSDEHIDSVNVHVDVVIGHRIQALEGSNREEIATWNILEFKA